MQHLEFGQPLEIFNAWSCNRGVVKGQPPDIIQSVESFQASIRDIRRCKEQEFDMRQQLDDLIQVSIRNSIILGLEVNMINCVKNNIGKQSVQRVPPIWLMRFLSDLPS